VKKRTPELDAEIGSLYALPLPEFTPARNALAVRLRKEGDREASERVKGLAKPSVSAWAVNVLFRDAGDQMKALLAAGDRARRALAEALTHGAAESLRDALQDERELRDALRRRAAALLTAEGSAPSRAIADRITVNLEALALSPAAAEAAERGWLDRDLDPPGFEVLAGLQLGARPARPEHRGLRIVPPPEKAREEKKPEPRKREEAAREREEKTERERREREQARAQERIARAEKKVAKIAAEAESLGKEAQRAEKAATDAERAAEEARRHAEAARKAADRAAERLTRAEADRDALG
jgi:hypothetical protein